jgi:hypothetical protein
MLTEDDISLVREAMKDASEDILQRYGAKQDELYGRIENELNEVKQDICSVCAVPTMSQIAELGDEPTQLRRLADAIEAQLQKAQEEKEKAIEALKQEKEEVLE